MVNHVEPRGYLRRSEAPRHHKSSDLGIAVVQHLQQAFLIEAFELSSEGLGCRAMWGPQRGPQTWW